MSRGFENFFSTIVREGCRLRLRDWGISPNLPVLSEGDPFPSDIVIVPHSVGFVKGFLKSFFKISRALDWFLWSRSVALSPWNDISISQFCP